MLIFLLQSHQVTHSKYAKPIYIKLNDWNIERTENSNTGSESDSHNKGNPLKVQSVEQLDNQQTSCTSRKQGGSEFIALLKPLLIEVFDEIKGRKHNNDEDINDKLQSMQRNVNEKIEFIKPILLEVLNELKKNKKEIQRELVEPQTAPEEIIKSMLIGVLDEIKESNRKTQEALNEMKKDKEQSLQDLKHRVDEKIVENFPKPLVYPKLNEKNDQMEYESTKEENGTTVESDEFDMSQELPQKVYTDSKKTQTIKSHEDTFKRKCLKNKRRHTTNHVHKSHSNLRKRRSTHKPAHNHGKYTFKKNKQSNNLSRNNSPSNIFNVTEILSNPSKQEAVKDVIKVMTKQKLVNFVSDLLADRFIHNLKTEIRRNDKRRMNRPKAYLSKIEGTTTPFIDIETKTTTTDKPVTIQRFEIFLG